MEMHFSGYFSCITGVRTQDCLVSDYFAALQNDRYEIYKRLNSPPPLRVLKPQPLVIRLFIAFAKGDRLKLTFIFCAPCPLASQ